MKQSKTFFNNVSGSTPYTTDTVMHIYMPSSISELIIYYDNGTAGQDAWLRVPWDTSGASDINLGFTTQSSPLEVIGSGLQSGQSIYVMLVWNPASQTFSISFNSAPWSASLQRDECFHDGSVPLFCSTNASSAAVVNSGGTVSLAANCGANWKVQST